MIKPIKLTAGWNNKIIFTMTRKTPTTTKQKTKTAKAKKILKALSI